MNLHVTEKTPQWEQVPPKYRNHWQRRAAETKGLDTPGNRLSTSGLLLVLAGLRELKKDRPMRATALVFTGRLLDLMDGTAAERTETKSPLGKRIDATADKLAMLAALSLDPRRGVLVEKGVLPKSAATLLYAHHALNGIFSPLAERKKGQNYSPSSLGKKSSFVQWASIGVGLIAVSAKAHGAEKAGAKFKKIENLGLGLGLAMGILATMGYANDALLSGQTNKVKADQHPPPIDS